MSEEKPDYLELARLSQESIKNRQSHAWRINFSIWVALALIAFAMIRGRVPVCSHLNCLTVIGLLALFAGYVWSIGLIGWAHSIDQKWKRYYVTRADGTPESALPTRKPAPGWEWPVSQILFTLGLIVLVIGVVIGGNGDGGFCRANDCGNYGSCARGFGHPMMMGDYRGMMGAHRGMYPGDSNEIVDSAGYGGFQCSKH